MPSGSAGKLHAVGRYQFIGNTSSWSCKKTKVPDDAKFTAVQDKMQFNSLKNEEFLPIKMDKRTPAERALVDKVRNQGGGSGVSIPRQKQYRHSIMSQLSMEAVQAKVCKSWWWRNCHHQNWCSNICKLYISGQRT